MEKNLFFILSIVGLIFILNGCSTTQKKYNDSNLLEVETLTINYSLNSQLEDLTEQIVASLSQKNKSKIAVIEFSDLGGNINEFGIFLAEELITRLFMTGKFEVVERQLLNKIIEEQELGLSGLIDDDSAIALGRILGVDAVASGSITDLGSSLKVNARLISTETGTIFAVASVEILKDNIVTKLINKNSSRISYRNTNTNKISNPIEKKEELVEKKNYSIRFSGSWYVNDTYNKFNMNLVQTEKTVKGTYTHKGGTINGTVIGNRLECRWYQPGNKKSGLAYFDISNDGKYLNGRWGYGQDRYNSN